MKNASASPCSLEQVAHQLGLSRHEFEPYGDLKAKLRVPEGLPPARGKLVLVTGMTPTRSGAGKTVTSIGLGQAFGRLGLRHCVCLREPSLGPVLGIKGGGTGGGRASLVPMEDINLHFTGDLHAVTSANNLIAACTDNHAHFDSEVGVNRDAITWPRVLDLCDRQLRHVELGLGGERDGFPHRGRFDITAASEVMAVLALAKDRADLRARLGRMVVAHDRDGRWVTVDQLGVLGALEVLLKEAMRPNLVQTTAGTPVLVHMGPFANIAHGCSSVVATRFALAHADYVFTEAGFGADLGAEKFVHLKCRQAGLAPAAAVLVMTGSALRKHGGAGKGSLGVPDPAAVARGMENVRVHVENLGKLGIPCVATLNRFPADSDAEVAMVRRRCDEFGIPFAVSDVFARGPNGGVGLARLVKQLADAQTPALKPLYELNAPLPAKIDSIARQLYRADGVDYTPEATRALARLEAQGLGELSICMAKTPFSLSDNPRLRGAPTGFRIQVRDAVIRAGAGFVVVLTGSTVSMPGLPRHSAAERIHLDPAGNVAGLT
ncbi:MAG: formate--tetrahydrofolate ligase [Myxococcales bacterium]|nr:formate--tetrahydrofolate ligase [Myxococcales bacterium]MDD9968925.1 formate--tetrahydrofolate ligase [Myxococcales bacterium]